MGGLYNTAESLGRFLGPAGFAVTYAWSISTTGVAGSQDWINHRFVFYGAAVLLVLCAAMAWSTLTHENLMKGEEREGAGGDVVVAESSSSSPRVATHSGHGGLGGREQGGGEGSIDVSFVSGPGGRREADLV